MFGASVTFTQRGKSEISPTPTPTFRSNDDSLLPF